MRLVTYRMPGGFARAGVLSAAGIFDAAALLGVDSSPLSVRELLEFGRLPELATALQRGGPAPIPLGNTLAMPPLPNPDKIICVGLNYRSHAAEAGLEPPPVPAIFAKFRNALVPSGETVSLPEASAKVDYEAEVAFVMGRRASHVPAQRAMDHVAGYMLFNDLSARDLQFASPQWMPGKVFDGSAPCGPALVTPDEAGAHDAISFELLLNGERLQHGATDDLIFGVPELVEHLSKWMTLEPGDIVSTGTPSGVGSVRDPKIWLKAGDRITISSPTLGVLETRLS